MDNGSQLGSMGGILSVDVLVSEDGLKVVTDDRNFDGEKIGFIIGELIGTRLGIKDRLSLVVSERINIGPFDGPFDGSDWFQMIIYT